MNRGEHEQAPAEGAPVGRVLLEPEEPLWEDAREVRAGPGRRWTVSLLLLALVLLMVMVAAMLLMLWGIFQTAPA